MSEDILNNGNVAFMVLTTTLVFIMIPALAFFYGGLVPRKSRLTMMIYTFLSIGIVTILWYLVGFSIVFGDDTYGIIGYPTQYMLLNGVDLSINPNYGGSIPFLMFCMYQLMFAIITAPLMTGAIAERITITGWIKVQIMWMLLIYFPVAHWVWGGGFLSQMGFVDYAGGTVIHVTAGFAALVGAAYLGKRAYPASAGNENINLVLIGTALLMMGWFGFNSGGALVGGKVAAIAFANTALASAVAMSVWVGIVYIRTRRFSFIQLATGAIAGLATITPCSGYVTPQYAVLIGAAGAIICYLSLIAIEKMGIDDALGVCGVHGMGGLSGTILLGALASKEIGGVTAGAQQLFIQTIGALIVLTYTAIVTYMIFKIANLTGSILVPPNIQKSGLDSKYISRNS